MREERKYSVFILSAIIVAVALVGAVRFSSLVHAQSVGVTLPSVPGGVSATVVPPSQISVSWGASAESSGTIVDYYVYRNGNQIATTGGTLFVDSGLTSGVYQYTIAAVDANGNVSAQSSPGSITFVVDKTPPSTPTNVTVTGATTTNSAYAQIPVTISWVASTDNVAVAGYKVYRNGMLLTTSTAPLTGTSYADTITPGTYWYTVVAYDASQNFSNQSAQTSFTVNVDNSAPSEPANVSAQQVSATEVNVSWLPSTDSVGIAGYQVYRNGIQIASVAGSPYADTGLSDDVQYSYAVAAYDNAGNVSAQSSPVEVLTQTPTGPGIPNIVSATAGTSTVKLLWTSVSDNLMVTGYTIYRNGSQIANVTSTNYLDQGLASGTYAYSVSAADVAGAVSSSSLSVSATVPAIGYIPPVSMVSPPVLTSPIVAPPTGTVVIQPAPSGAAGTTFTQFLYFGLRGGQVEALQSFLSANGYLAPVDATGFFGNLTLHALEQFQCNQNIVCSGGAGWGLVGSKTRSALNGFEGNAISSTPSSLSSSSSAANLTTEIQALEAELLKLEASASAAGSQ